MLGIIGRSSSAKSLATRGLAFKMSVLYFDVVDVSEVPIFCTSLGLNVCASAFNRSFRGNVVLCLGCNVNL